MTDWLLQQQGVLSVTLLLMLLSEKCLTEKLGAKLAYQLWLFVPLVLVMNNLPNTMLPAVSDSFTRYIVTMSPANNLPSFDLLLAAWGMGAAVIFTFVAFHYVRLLASVAHTPSFQFANKKAYTSSVATTPMLFGFAAPRILLPNDFERQFTTIQQSMILEHEYVHYQHRDHLWNLLALALALTFWFNPLVWIALRAFRINQELACDATVLRHKTKTEKVLYATALVQCAEHSLRNITLYPTFGDKSTMIKRINLIKQPVATSKAIGIAALLIGSLFTANTALASLVPPPPPKNEVNQATPVMRVDPVYPMEAAKQGIEGSVVLQFDITESGETDNINIVDSFPEGTFDKSAINALSQWQYKPRIQGGVAQRQTALRVQLDYRLDEDSLKSSTDIEKIKVSAK